MKRLALLLAVAPLSGCVYFNGIYNAQRAEHRADALRRAGHSLTADSLYRAASVAADSVLAHHATSKWAGSAELIGGWSLAMTGDCDRATPLLAAARSRPGASLAAAARAQTALGICAVRDRRYREARALLVPVVGMGDRRSAPEAAVWAAVAALALGEPDSARSVLLGVEGASVDWQLAHLDLEQERWAPAESLLFQRALRGDFRPDLLVGIARLWRAGRTTAVRRIVSRYDRSSVSSVTRARIHHEVGTLALESGDDATARASFETLARLTRDSTEAREARATLTALALRDLPSLADVRTAIEQGRARAAGTTLQRRLDDNLLLAELLRDRDDGSGAGTFLAAEVARDSLRAYALARAFFLEAARLPESPVSLRAREAASALPDTADSPAPGIAGMLADTEADAGEVEPARAKPALAGADRAWIADSVLGRVWRSVLTEFADSVRQRRAAARTTPGGAPAPDRS